MTANDYLLVGVDQGTTNTKAVAVDGAGRIVAEASRPIATHAPEPGWVEQDPLAMLGNVVDCVREVLERTGREAGSVAGLGISNQTETLVVWDRETGEPALPAIVWQCRRGEKEIDPLMTRETRHLVRERTGLDLDPTFTAAKLKWLFEARPEIARRLEEGTCLFGTVDCWLTWKLSEGATYATEPGNASRTMLFDINALAWDASLAELFGLSLREKPQVLKSADAFGETGRDVFGAPIPITAALGDQQASLFGHGCFKKDQMKVTYGTGAFTWINAGSEPRIDTPEGLVRTIGWHLDEPAYALEGFVMSAGASLEWLARHLGVPDGGRGVVAEAETVGTSDGVYLVPAFQGLATPWWRPRVRAGLIGMSEATTRGHLCHAGLEAICYQIRTIVEAIGDSPDLEVKEIKVDGGPTRSRYLMQLQADILQGPISPAKYEAVTPYGVALMAGLGAGVWRTPGDLAEMIPAGSTVVPNPASATDWDDTFAEWRKIVYALLALYAGQ